MQRRLDDVSHFFFDHQSPNTTHEPLSQPARSGEGRPRVVHLTSLGDELATVEIVAGLAEGACRLGHRVLVAETHEHPFGVEFAFAGVRRGQPSGFIEISPGLRVSSAPLLGVSRPGLLFDPRASADWIARANQSTLVLVRTNYRARCFGVPGMLVPDEFLIVVGDSAPDGPLHGYHAIKRAISVNPSVELGLVVVGDQNNTVGGVQDTLVRAVATFLGRQCPVVGAVGNLSSDPQALPLGATRGRGPDGGPRALERIAHRWTTPEAMARRQTVPSSSRSDKTPLAKGLRVEELRELAR